MGDTRVHQRRCQSDPREGNFDERFGQLMATTEGGVGGALWRFNFPCPHP